MGNNLIKKKKRIIPINNKYVLDDNKILKIDNNNYVKLEDYRKLLLDHNNLKLELERLKNSSFECIVCYNKDFEFKQPIRCKHDLCINCYHLIRDKKCPLCRTKIK